MIEYNIRKVENGWLLTVSNSNRKGDSYRQFVFPSLDDALIEIQDSVQGDPDE